MNDAGVRYLVVGAHALAFHAIPRATKDLDIYVEPTKVNLRRFVRALGNFFAGSPPAYAVEDLGDPDTILQLGVAPVRIDVLFRVDGVRGFRGAWSRRSDGRFGRQPAHYLGWDDLVAAKTAAGRPQDLADLDHLRRARRRK